MNGNFDKIQNRPKFIQEEFIIFCGYYYSALLVICAAMNSFTTDENVENHIEKTVDFPFCSVDLLLQGGYFTLVRTKMSLQSHLLTVCTRCAQEVWNDKGPMEGPLSNIALSPLGW